LAINDLVAFVRDEAVVHLDDLVLRRLDWGENPELALRIGPRLCAALGWNEAKTKAEIERLRATPKGRRSHQGQ